MLSCFLCIGWFCFLCIWDILFKLFVVFCCCCFALLSFFGNLYKYGLDFILDLDCYGQWTSLYICLYSWAVLFVRYILRSGTIWLKDMHILNIKRYGQIAFFQFHPLCMRVSEYYAHFKQNFLFQNFVIECPPN